MTQVWSLFLKRALQRMLLLSGTIHDLVNLGFRNIIREDTANSDTPPMDMEHDCRRFVARFSKNRFEHVNDEFHWRIIVVQHQHFVHAGFFGLWLCFGEQPGLPTVIFVHSTAAVIVIIAQKRTRKRIRQYGFAHRLHHRFPKRIESFLLKQRFMISARVAQNGTPRDGAISPTSAFGALTYRHWQSVQIKPLLQAQIKALVRALIQALPTWLHVRLFLKHFLNWCFQGLTPCFDGFLNFNRQFFLPTQAQLYR